MAKIVPKRSGLKFHLSAISRKAAYPIGPRQALYFILCGLHSGFRDCCIMYFTWVWLQSSGKKLLKHGKDIFLYEVELGKHHGYIPCPECIKAKRKPVRVKKCDCDEKFESDKVR